MEKLLNELVKRLQEAYGSNLVSVVLYGSAVTEERDNKFSDLNVLCTLQRVGVAELRQGEKAIQWWVKQKQRPPFLFSVEEFRSYDDVFPIEFLDIQQSHRVLYGEDPTVTDHITSTNHRRQLVHELCSNILRLRQRYLVVHPHAKEVVRLMVESIPTFATLARHVLVLAGSDAPTRKHEIFDAAAARFGLDAAPFHTVLRVREGAEKIKDDQAHILFAAYMEQIVRLMEVQARL